MWSRPPLLLIPPSVPRLSPQGILRIHFIEAQDLLIKDKLLGGLIKGKSDPYGVVQIGTQVFQSKVKHETINPKWNEVYEVSGEVIPSHDCISCICESLCCSSSFQPLSQSPCLRFKFHCPATKILQSLTLKRFMFCQIPFFLSWICVKKVKAVVESNSLLTSWL